MSPEKAITIDDLRRMAMKRLPDFVTSYVERGAGDGGGVARNIDAFRKHRFVPRAFVDVSPVDTATELFGRSYASCFGVSAVGTSGIYRRHADEMLAEAAQEANLPFILSGSASASVETIVRLAPDHTWYQVYGAKDSKLTEHMMGRARDAGVEVLVYTVDFPIPQRSEVIERTGVSLASGPTLRTLPRLFIDAARHPRWTAEYLRHKGMPRLESWASYTPPGSKAGVVSKFYLENWLGNQGWHDLDRIRKQWGGKLVVKGLVHPDDVVRAVQAGADAVTVSNHGGNKLDCMQGCLDALAAIRPVVGPDITIFFDGGIRRGSDIVIARALGATHCFVGRATLYGVAAGGRAGGRRAMQILMDDLEYTMAMIGCRTLADISRACLADPTPAGLHQCSDVLRLQQR